MTQPNQGNQKKKCRHTKAFHFQTKIFILNNKPYQLQSCVHPVFPEQSLFQSCTHTSWTSSPDHKTPDFLCLIKIGCVNITLKIALNQRLTTFQRKKNPKLPTAFCQKMLTLWFGQNVALYQRLATFHRKKNPKLPTAFCQKMLTLWFGQNVALYQRLATFQGKKILWSLILI